MLTVTETTWFDHLKAIVLENDILQVVVLPERGGEIHRIRHRVTGMDYLYLREPDITRFQNDVQAGTVGAAEDYFFNGMYVMFPNAATPAEVNGKKYEFHGDIRHVAWDYNIGYDEPGTRVYMDAESRNVPLGIHRTLKLDETLPRLTVTDDVLYTGDGDAVPFIYGLHPYHGYPLFDEGTTIKMGDEVIVTLPARTEQLMRLDDVPSTGLIEIYNPHLKTGLRFEYSPELLPFTWVWLHLNPPGEPQYVGSLLPCTNTWAGGIEKALELNTAKWLNHGEQMTFSWQIEVI